MLIVLLIIGIVVFGGVGKIGKRFRFNKDAVDAAQFLSLVCVVFILIAVIACSIGISSRLTIDRQIALYESENERIEQQISSIVEEYKQYEMYTYEKFSKRDVEVVVNLFPELKSNELVRKQIEVYTENNSKIKELKSQRIKTGVYAWWLYFGE